MRRTIGAVVAAMLLLAGWSVLRAQTRTAPPAEPDIMPALLEEVRGLRAALEQMSSAGARVQLALGRLQLQEARVNTTVKRLDEARTRLGQLQLQEADAQRQVAGFDAALKDGRFKSPSGEGPSREELEDMRADHQRRLAQLRTEIQRLSAEESVYATDLASEQARWTEFNQRLEDLERALRPLK